VEPVTGRALGDRFPHIADEVGKLSPRSLIEGEKVKRKSARLAGTDAGEFFEVSDEFFKRSHITFQNPQLLRCLCHSDAHRNTHTNRILAP
jgi:hypothetical protein